MTRIMFQRGLTDDALARLAHIARSRLNRLKNGRLRPTVRDALCLAEVLGVEVEDIFSLAEEPVKR